MSNVKVMKSKSKNLKEYIIEDEVPSVVEEAAVPYITKRKTDSFKDFIYSDIDVHRMIKQGVSKKLLDNTLRMMGVSLDEMSNILHVSERTIRRYTDETLLNIEQSERILELTKLYHYGEEVFGSLDTFKKWMDSTIIVLGQKKPKEFLDTSVGIKLLTNLLGRIEHGVFS